MERGKGALGGARGGWKEELGVRPGLLNEVVHLLKSCLFIDHGLSEQLLGAASLPA